tara:strand:+ start:101 stop:478 length:378 start_codon:yes stop_codon:yes gene_type:complete
MNFPQNPNLVEISSSIQKARGNRQFFDIKHNVHYISYANGYVRREIRARFNPGNILCRDQFIINKRPSKKVFFNSGSYQCSYMSKSVLKEPSAQERLNIIDRVSSNYKGYKGRFSNKDLYTLSVR